MEKGSEETRMGQRKELGKGVLSAGNGLRPPPPGNSGA